MDAVTRAAQFSPFAALTGYEKALEETKEIAIERVEHEVEREDNTEEAELKQINDR